MNGNIQASDEQQQILTEKNIAKVYSGEPDNPSLAVTNNGVTIEPDTVIVDERFVYMAFCISGYSVADRMEPVYEDGSIISHYTDDNGNMEYIIQASVADKDDSFLGKIMHVEFKNLGTLSKAAFIPAVDGEY